MRPRASRLRLAAWLSAASLTAVVPHVIEDATLGVPQRFGLSVEAAGWLFGLFVAALIDHAGAFQTGSFRAGLASRVWVWSIVGLQGAVAALAGSVVLPRRS
jgi:hypothetical protein